MFEAIDEDGVKKKVSAPFIQCGSLPISVLVLKLQQQGKTKEEIHAAVRDAYQKDPSIVENPVKSDSSEPAEPAQAVRQDDQGQTEQQAYYHYRYLYAYARLITGQIHNLNAEELGDVVMLATVPAVGFQEWMDRKGFVS